MTTITIPKTVRRHEKLVAIPKEIYEEFIAWQKKIKSIPTFKPTAAERRAIARGRKNFARGAYVRFEDLAHERGVDR